MPARERPAAVAETRLHNAYGVIDVPAPQMQKVRYVFKITSAKNVRLPYAVAVNGIVLPAFATTNRRVDGSGGHIDVQVLRGSRVGLYLNSDAHPSYRKQLVYEITVGSRDVEVVITEKLGRHSDSDTPVRQPQAPGAAPDAVDRYAAPLTGDIWMKVSHRYTAAEVEGLMPAGTPPEVVAAIKNIYAALKAAQLTIVIPAAGEKPAKTLTVTFDDSENPRQNISRYALLEDGLTRVHPGGYAALFNAALDSDVPSLRVTSCWRPMLGSIAHRAGLGLDVNYVGKVRMNRQELLRSKGNGDDTDNVTDAEVERFHEFERADGEYRKAQREFESAAIEARKAQAEWRRTTGDRQASLPDDHAAAQAHLRAAAALKKADTDRQKALERWQSEMEKGQPTSIRRFRGALMQCTCVGQIFDPWYMDSNTRIPGKQEANLQKGANETLHSNHLHITVHEPSIL